MIFSISRESKKYFINTIALFFEKVFKLFLGFFVIVLLTRYLGPEKFGLLSYVQAYVSIGVAIAALGLDQIVTREIVKKPEARDSVLGTTFCITLLSSAIVILFSISLAYFSEDKETAILISILSFTILFATFGFLIDAYFQAKVLSKYAVYSNTVVNILSSFIKIYLILIKVDLIYFIYALLLDGIFMTIGYIYIYKAQNLSIKDWRFDKELARRLIKLSLPLVFIAITAYIYTRTDLIMIKHILGNKVAGEYAAALRVSELFFFIPSVIAMSIFPKIVSLKDKNYHHYLNLLENLYRVVFWLGLIVAISISFFSQGIVNLLFGDSYIKSAQILRILSFSIIFISINAVFVKFLYAENYEKKYLYKNLLGVIVNISLNYLLIKSYGVIGAAYATLITLFVINYLYDIFDKDLRNLYHLKIVCITPFYKK